MRKQLLLILAGLCMTVLLTAGPAKRQKTTLTLTDGTQISATLFGDEHLHYYQAEDGTRYRLLNNGQAEKITEPQMNTLREHADRRRGAIQNYRAERAAKLRYQHSERRRAQIGVPLPEDALKGKHKGLIILVNYSDRTFHSDRQEIDDMVNLEGYNRNGHIGSMHDYFYAQSYGQFDVSFDVVGPLTLSHTHDYYGTNDSYGDDLYAATMVAEACRLADPLVNFRDYDWDGDGEVDQVYVIYQGYSEAQSSNSKDIWPHQFSLTEAIDYGDGNGPIVLDGVTIDSYACSSELSGSSGNRIDGIGNACHEFSHCLGLPDLYDISGGSCFGMDRWSLMDYGNYNGDCCIPAAYTAFERWFAGWMELKELPKTGATIQNMKHIADAPEAYIIYNDSNRNEYYVLQNIQVDGWNQDAYGHGLLVMHVHYIPNEWRDNNVNTINSHQLCTIFHADNRSGSSKMDMAGDPYPGTSYNTELSSKSTPVASLYTINTNRMKLMNKPIENIRESKGLISFDYCGGSPEDIQTPLAPTAHQSAIDLQGRNWNNGRGIYVIEGRKILQR